MRLARDLGAHLHVDMESLDSRETVLELVLELLSEDEFAHGPSAGVVVQAYLRDSPETVEQMLDWARRAPRAAAAGGAPREGRLLGPRDRRGPPPRLAGAGVRGEGRERPQLRGAHAPPAGGPPARARRRRLAQPALRRPRDRLQPRARRDGPRPRAPGAARPRRRPPARARAAGPARARRTAPSGDLVAGMAYLVRRLLENTSNESFLAAQTHGASVEELLAAP